METECQEAAKPKIPVQVATTSAPTSESSANTQKSGSKNVLPPAWKWWQSLGSPRFILSPMVGQSELAYRMLCRKHGVQLCYTPMFIAESFVHDAAYRKRIWSTCKEDRPLFVQFCGNKPEVGLYSFNFITFPQVMQTIAPQTHTLTQ